MAYKLIHIRPVLNFLTCPKLRFWGTYVSQKTTMCLVNTSLHCWLKLTKLKPQNPHQQEVGWKAMQPQEGCTMDAHFHGGHKREWPKWGQPGPKGTILERRLSSKEVAAHPGIFCSLCLPGFDNSGQPVAAMGFHFPFFWTRVPTMLYCYTVYYCILGVMKQPTCGCLQRALNHEEPHPDPIVQAVHNQILGWDLDAGTGWNFGVTSPQERTFEALGEWRTQTFDWPKGWTGDETANWPLMVMISFFYL